MAEKKGGGSKKISGYIKLQIPAGAANPSPPVGPALGQKGVNIMEFCKAFNSKTEGLPNVDKGTPVPVIITVYSDRSFSFVVKSPPAAVLLKKIAKVQKGSDEPNKNKVGKITREQLEQIVEIKREDLTAANLDAGVRTIAGTAQSMGLEVIEK